MATGNIVSKAEIVKYVKEAFDSDDIEKVWAYLGKKFGFNIPAWKEDFMNSLTISKSEKSVQVQFMEFGKRRIEPILNDVLCRKAFPTWINLLAYLLEEKIRALQQRDRYYKNRFN
jgi:hypothetical protein